MADITTVTINFIGEKFPRLAYLVRTATRADFISEFGNADISSREERAIATGDYIVVRRIARGREGRDITVHKTALGKCATCQGTGRIHSSCDPYGIAPCPACRPSNPKEGA